MQNQQRQPLILTLKLDEVSQSFFNNQRDLYFPPERNFLEAHLTLFHQLPDVRVTYEHLESLVQKPFGLDCASLLFLGAGVAYRVESDELTSFHQSLKSFFEENLIPQDRQKFNPHVVIQNKVKPEIAKMLMTKLIGEFMPFEMTALGISLWRYAGGPWEFLVDYNFDKPDV